ncbi:MAG: biosynthetic-type acetolactate synthase large subunit [Nitrospinota bacterium]
MRKTGSEIVIEELKAQGVEVTFGMPGGTIMPFYDALYGSGIRHILIRHEQGAAMAADGYARATGKVGVCMATSGPGATNLLTGLMNSLMDSVPIVALTGQVATNMIGSDAFQEADVYGMSIPCTKYNYLVKDVAQLPSVVREAFQIARTGRPGPVLIDLPKDMQVGVADYDPNEKHETMMVQYEPPFEVDPEGIARMCEVIHSARRPIIYAGHGIVLSGCSDLLRQFVQKTQMPITTTLLGLGIYPLKDPLCLGMPGMHGSHTVNYALSECDCCIALGVRFDDRVTGDVRKFASKATICHVEIDAAEIGKRVRPHISLHADVSKALEVLVREVEPGNYSAWREELAEVDRRYPLKYNWDGTIKPQYFLEQLHEVAGSDIIMTTGVGQHQMWAAQFYPFDRPRTWLTSGGLGAMGYGLPAAIGAQMAHPDKLVINIDGDGSFQINIQELATIDQYSLPVKTIILNNQYLGMVRQWQEFFFEKRYSESYYTRNPDFAKVAEGFGVRGMQIKEVDQVRPVLEEALAHDGPVVLDVFIKQEENVLPMVPSGAGLMEMIEENYAG